MADSRAELPQLRVERSDDWGYEGARRFALEQALRMTHAERLRWLEKTMVEMRSLCGLADPERSRKSRQP